MNRRITLSVGAAAGGLLATGFLPVAVAFADSGVRTVGDAAGAWPVGDAANATPLGDAAGTTPLETAIAGDAGILGNAGGTSPFGEALGSTPAGDAAGSSDAFTIGNFTFDPVFDGSEGYAPVSPLFSAPPFFEVGEANQTFEVTSAAGSSTDAGSSGTGSGTDAGSSGTGSGTDAGSSGAGSGADAGSSDAGSGATDLGTISTNEDVANLFGVHNTEFTVTGVDPASGETASDLPPVGSVYDVANFGNGFENVYVDIPGSGSSGDHITDTLVTPFGNFNIPTDFDAIQALNPGEALSGVDVSGGATEALGGATNAAGGAADGASGAADGSSGAADAASGAGDAASGAADAGSAADAAIDPLSFLGF
jgi:hypothetical protein